MHIYVPMYSTGTGTAVPGHIYYFFIGILYKRRKDSEVLLLQM